jgi:ubiquinone/menaquinone biosynthesis C-methylase UbiE
MFSRSARVYDAIYATLKDFALEAARVHELVQARKPGARTLLDVACGTGAHLEHLAARYEVEGLDADDAMLAVARERLPEVPLHEGDMADFELGRRFDAITCLFSSIGYVRTVERLQAAVGSMARHLEPGGVLVVEPWFEPEAWQGPSGPYAVFVDLPELKVARVNLSPPAGDTVVLDMHHVIGTPEGVESFVERHELGMFAHEQYLEAFMRGGLEVEHDEEGLIGRGLYLATRGA